jgi:alpha-1,2-mannosyltransferase
MRTVVFHPFAHAGGGGEQVLLHIVRAASLRSHFVFLHVHSVASARSALPLPDNVVVKPLRSASLLHPGRYSFASLLLELSASALAASEALLCHLLAGFFSGVAFIDTSGCALAYPLARCFCNARVVSYVHYPALRRDMLLSARRTSRARFLYTRLLLLLYSLALSCAHILACNSSWTHSELSKILPKSSRPRILHPPVDFDHLMKLPLARKRAGHVVSLGQFRPEKEHITQLHVWKALTERLSNSLFGSQPPQLTIMGGCRNDSDKQRARALKDEAKRLDIDHCVDIIADAEKRTIDTQLASATAGLHTMKHEHFGISIVEFMAAGVIPVCHKSGGPALDILPGQYDAIQDNRCGYLARNMDEMVDSLEEVLTLAEEKRVQIAERARESASTFSSSKFEQRVKETFTEALRAGR